MQIKNNNIITMFYSRVQIIFSRHRSGSKDSRKPTLKIVSPLSSFHSLLWLHINLHANQQSAPFNFQREPVSLPGISHDE
jgi:hypothetical protein